MRRGSKRAPDIGVRQQLIQSIGQMISRFQESSNAFDDVAAEMLAVDRRDLSCMTALLFGGPASPDVLASALRLSRSALATTLERLQLAGYARRQPGAAGRFELSEHASRWIERIWAPLWKDGSRLLGAFPTRQLALTEAFVRQVCDIQEARTRQLRTWLTVPASSARRTHARGGLSPAALRRVQVFVEGNLGQPIRLRDLAGRAGLSPYHFARAFKTSAGLTPRAFVEQRRIARAKELLTGTMQPLAELAVTAGFGTQSRLTSTLRRRTGFTPAEYRRAALTSVTRASRSTPR